jgi:hypothetical protein
VGKKSIDSSSEMIQDDAKQCFLFPSLQGQIRVEKKPVEGVEDLKALLEPGHQPWSLGRNKGQQFKI